VNFLYLEQSLLCNDSKRIERAINSACKLVEFLFEDVAYINLLAMAYERLGNYRQSLTFFYKIIQKGIPKSENTIAITSNALRLLCTNSLYASAMEIYQTVVDQEAFQDSFNLIYLSLCYFYLGRYEDCLKTMDTAIEISTDAAVETELLLTLGRVIFSLDEIDGNIEIAKEQFFKWYHFIC
jgi:tetratricopeptide (TPR) repeat protein